ncbi:MAG: HlyC/CorC family transporter [Thermoflexales bacterium]|nr:HlyC/CorC family transporter [Thermoflexales bacterium]
MVTIAGEILVIFLLIVLNGVFAMSEIAVISANKTRLQRHAEDGDLGARTALELALAPGHFLSTVQIGITLVGVLAGAFGGATIAETLAASISQVPQLAAYSEAIGVSVVVVAISYLSLVIGELVPKQLALSNAERIASIVAAPMRRLSALVFPLVSVLGASTQMGLRLLGVRASTEPSMTEDEIRLVIRQAAQSGVIETVEEDMVQRLLRLGDRRISSLMTPRTEIEWLDVQNSPEELERQIMANPHAYFPLALGIIDNVVGMVRARDFMSNCLAGQPANPQDAAQPPLFIPESMSALRALESFKTHRSHIALVVDEYGGVEGMVTIGDILEAIVGDIALEDGRPEPEAVQREDGSWLLDGLLSIQELKELLDLEALPGEEEANYQTLGGFIMAYLGRIPAAADHFEYGGMRFEVIDMDGNRIDKVLVIPASKGGSV